MTETFDGSLFGADQPCFGCSTTNAHGMHLTFTRDGEEVVTRFTPSGMHQGPPGIMHGGLVTTVADELAAWTLVLLREKFGFTAEIQAKLHRPLRVGIEAEGRGRIVRDSRRVVRIGVELTQTSRRVFEGELAFVLLDRGGAQQLLGGEIPEAWERFCR